MSSKSYKDLEIYQTSLELFYKSHKLSLKLPKYEYYELGSQLRRSADAVVTNIVEGYGRRKYKADFLKFIYYSYSSCLETHHHVEKINTLYPDFNEESTELINRYDNNGAKIYNFLKYVEANWRN